MSAVEVAEAIVTGVLLFLTLLVFVGLFSEWYSRRRGRSTPQRYVELLSEALRRDVEVPGITANNPAGAHALTEFLLRETFEAARDMIVPPSQRDLYRIEIIGRRMTYPAGPGVVTFHSTYEFKVIYEGPA